ncbi:hypothetical protein ACIQM4_34480 [Streptomyces sp. NPDC091272]|uniref:hypothetical protein n=1 Tax=Streptomyces sp. NPDC091272 TaxID=3365981 RepID=UPI00380D2840
MREHWNHLPFAARCALVLWPCMGVLALLLDAAGAPALLIALAALAAGWALGMPMADRESARRTTDSEGA